MEKKSLIMALNITLRLRNESLANFAGQIANLTAEDRVWFSGQLKREGLFEVENWQG